VDFSVTSAAQFYRLKRQSGDVSGGYSALLLLRVLVVSFFHQHREPGVWLKRFND
jgi:hypothetical protein